MIHIGSEREIKVEMKCLINQPAGLGDIIFCQKISDLFIKNGYEIIWPVVKEYYSTVRDYMGKDNLHFCSIEDDFPYKDIYNSGQSSLNSIVMPNRDIYLPLRFADKIFPGMSVLKAKYKNVGVDYKDWLKYFKFVRNKKKEEELYYNILGLKDDSNYAFINPWYGSPPNSVKKEINVEHENIIEMRMIEGYSIFDWSLALERAEEIHSVDTGLFYIIENINTTAKKMEAYSKFEPSSYFHIEDLFKKQWNYK